MNAQTGEVTLWDSKNRSGVVLIKDSPTFKFGSKPYEKAVEEARRYIEDSSLPPDVMLRSLDRIENGDFNLKTSTLHPVAS